MKITLLEVGIVMLVVAWLIARLFPARPRPRFGLVRQSSDSSYPFRAVSITCGGLVAMRRRVCAASACYSTRFQLSRWSIAIIKSARVSMFIIQIVALEIGDRHFWHILHSQVFQILGQIDRSWHLTAILALGSAACGRQLSSADQTR